MQNMQLGWIVGSATGGGIIVTTIMTYLGKLTAEYGLALGICMVVIGGFAGAIAWLVLDARKARIAFSKEIKEIHEEHRKQITSLNDEHRAELRDIIKQNWTVIGNNTQVMGALAR